MTRKSKTVTLEQDLERLEAAFLERLRVALRLCASGTWGLFGQNDHLAALPMTKDGYGSSDAQALMDMVTEIAALRKRLGFVGKSPVCERFLAYRNLRGDNVPGEPRLAQRFLNELGAE